MAYFCAFFDAAAFTEKEHGFGFYGAKKVHNSGGVGGANAEVDHGQVAAGAGLHRAALAVDFSVIKSF